MSFPNILRKTIDQNFLEVSYDGLLDFEIMINVDFLKWKGQYLRLIQEFAILMILATYLALSTNALRWLQKIWSKPGVDKLLHLLMVLINSALENSGHSACWYNSNLSRSWKLISLS